MASSNFYKDKIMCCGKGHVYIPHPLDWIKLLKEASRCAKRKRGGELKRVQRRKREKPNERRRRAKSCGGHHRPLTRHRLKPLSSPSSLLRFLYCSAVNQSSEYKDEWWERNRPLNLMFSSANLRKYLLSRLLHLFSSKSLSGRKD